MVEDFDGKLHLVYHTTAEHAEPEPEPVEDLPIPMLAGR
jgi:hypothetical protein